MKKLILFFSILFAFNVNAQLATYSMQVKETSTLTNIYNKVDTLNNYNKLFKKELFVAVANTSVAAYASYNYTTASVSTYSISFNTDVQIVSVLLGYDGGLTETRIHFYDTNFVTAHNGIIVPSAQFGRKYLGGIILAQSTVNLIQQVGSGDRELVGTPLYPIYVPKNNAIYLWFQNQATLNPSASTKFYLKIYYKKQ